MTLTLQRPVHKDKLLQFRCPKCQRLLFKYRIGEDKMDYVSPGITFQKDTNGMMYVNCTKCRIILDWHKEGLTERMAMPDSQTSDVNIYHQKSKRINPFKKLFKQLGVIK